MPTAADLRCAYVRPGKSLTGVRYQIGWRRSTKAWVSKLANLERNFCRNVKAVRHGSFSDSLDNELMRHFAWFSDFHQEVRCSNREKS